MLASDSARTRFTPEHVLLVAESLAHAERLPGRQVVYRHLFRIFEKMDETELRADKTYRKALHRFPKNTRLLRRYALFLEEARASRRRGCG